MLKDDHIPAGLEPYFKRNRDGSFSIIDIVSKKLAVAGEVPGYISLLPYYSDGIKKLKRHHRPLQVD